MDHDPLMTDDLMFHLNTYLINHNMKAGRKSKICDGLWVHGKGGAFILLQVDERFSVNKGIKSSIPLREYATIFIENSVNMEEDNE